MHRAPCGCAGILLCNYASCCLGGASCEDPDSHIDSGYWTLATQQRKRCKKHKNEKSQMAWVAKNGRLSYPKNPYNGEMFEYDRRDYPRSYYTVIDVNDEYRLSRKEFNKER